MPTPIERVERALTDLAAGKMIILMDDAARENEGDLIIVADKITPDAMNFMIRNGSGIVCLSMTSEQLNKLDLPLMVPVDQNTSFRQTPFTLSIDARDNITTGVSATDRTITVQVAVKGDATPDQLVRPGHIFPLQAKDGGVLERQGHTEGAVDLARLAGFTPAAVLCEIMNADGTMAHGAQIDAFAKQHQLTILSIDDIIAYRLRHENMIEEEASTVLPIDHYGSFTFTAIKDKISSSTHIVLENPTKSSDQPCLVRIHSSCITGDLFSSKRCDCNKQLHYSLERISKEGGILIYLNQEGRGIGLLNKIKAYALQEKGFDTVEANEELGLPVDSRNYFLAANILRRRQLTHIRLLTNNPIKVDDLKKYGIENVEREAIPSFHNEHNEHYLKTKILKLKHVINI